VLRTEPDAGAAVMPDIVIRVIGEVRA
jgi:hypothetical protein